MKRWPYLILLGALVGGGVYISIAKPFGTPATNTPITTNGRPEIAPGLPLATNISSTATTSASQNDSVIEPGTSAPTIVGDNLMLGMDINAKLGHYLIGYTGMTLYTFAKDNVGTSTCYDACSQLWPPYVVSPNDRYNLQYGINANNVGFITRADGTLQLTYNGLPLYFYSGDERSGDFNGQGFHGVWYVVKV
ncbi:MAG TPA: hypothetical protein VMU13_03005 [Candidatus Paceibacterota bacterium]|nr:hypothetical protein [Candidatus Paceibacterota bacterium]